MTRTSRPAALVLAGLATAGTFAVTGTTAASAAGAPYTGTPIGTLDVRPASGTDQSSIDYTTSAPCPDGTHFLSRLYGAGLPDEGEVVTAKTAAGFSRTAPITSGVSTTLRTVAERRGITLSGRYDLVLRCTEQLGERNLGEFRSVLTFSSPTGYTASAAPATSAPATTAPATTAPATTAPASTAPGTPSPSGVALGPLRLVSLTPRTTTPGVAVTVSVTGTPSQRVELVAYSRPSTEYAVARSGILSADGRLSFVVAPGTNTRLYVRYQGLDSSATESAAVSVRTALSLSVRRLRALDYVFEGRLLPRRAGQLITLYRVTGGREVVTAQVRSDSTGTWRIPRKFTGRGTFDFVARTGQSLTNAAGSSNVRRVAVS